MYLNFSIIFHRQKMPLNPPVKKKKLKFSMGLAKDLPQIIFDRDRILQVLGENLRMSFEFQFDGHEGEYNIYVILSKSHDFFMNPSRIIDIFATHYFPITHFFTLIISCNIAWSLMLSSLEISASTKK